MKGSDVARAENARSAVGSSAEGDLLAMKAITLWQPWASLCFVTPFGGVLKKFETRSWPTFYRGPLAVHAAARKPPIVSDDLDDLCSGEFGNHWGVELPFGVVLGTVDLVECKSVDAYDVDAIEKLCGDWSPGRFAWRLENSHPFPTPIPAKGLQGFWNWKPEPSRAAVVECSSDPNTRRDGRES